MDNKALLEELATHTNILEYHIKRLKKKPDEIHELDKEVMGEKVKEIYKLVFRLATDEVIRETVVPSEKDAVKIPMVEVKPEPEIPRPSAPEMSSESPGSPIGAIRDETGTDAGVEDPVTVEEEPVTANEPAATDAAAEEPEPEHVPHTTDPIPRTTADLFSGPTTIADSFQAKDDNSIASKVNPTDIRDLKMAIGINDKFLFINELFKGDPSVYNQAIENLNTANGMQEATAAIESYRSEYAWSDNSEAYHRLKKIVMSKYNG
ncbi:MAG: hypothetical protein V2I47_02255 [Bacteroidales bacterium]|jgi:hypothetical protein|nr:hypothetical protein [Bacteroidales bacterium]